MEVQYDRLGRIKYNPQIHKNHGKEYTVSELAYLCKYYQKGNTKTLSMDLGRTETSIQYQLSKLRRTGQFDFFKNLKIEGEIE